MNTERTYHCVYCRREDSKANLIMQRARGVRFGWEAYHLRCRSEEMERRKRAARVDAEPMVHVAYASCGNIERRSYTIEQAATRIVELEEHCERVGLELAMKTAIPTMTTPETAGEPDVMDRTREWVRDFEAEPYEDFIDLYHERVAILAAYDTLTARLREVEGERGELRQRVQVAEKAARVTVEDCRRQGVSVGRYLANAACDMYVRQNKELRAQLTAATERAAHTGLTLQQRVTQTRLHTESVNGNCTSACLASVFGGDIESFDVRIPFTPDWWSHVEAIFRERGLLVLQLSPVDGTPAGTSFVAGVSPRGVRHLCVAQDGAIVHDPHPSRAGLTEITDYWVAIPWVFPSDPAPATAAAPTDAAGEG